MRIRVLANPPSPYQIRHMHNLSFSAIREMNGRTIEIGCAGLRRYQPREFLDGMRTRPFLMTRYWAERRRWRKGALSGETRLNLGGPCSMQSWMDRQ